MKKNHSNSNVKCDVFYEIKHMIVKFFILYKTEQDKSQFY